jgi:ADP-ribosylation factor GTPase-activating protein 1
MVDTTNPFNVIKYLLEKDYENKICVECKSPMPTHVSINNAIILCGVCAEKHKQLGYNISYIRELKDEWDQYLLNFLERGGNSRYIRFCNQYELNQMPIEEKLKTKIMDYYRLLVSKKYFNIINIFLKIDKN